MTKNTITIDLKDNSMSAVSMVRATRDHICSCGNNMQLTIEWPEGLTNIGAITVTGVNCPQCLQQVVLPAGHHWVEDYQLRWKPVE